MMNFLKAELKRLYTRPPRLVALLVVYILTIVATILVSTIGKSGPIDDYTFVRAAYVTTKLTLVLGVGLVELLCVFDDSFKARLQVSMIANGFSRTKALMAQWLEYLIVVIIDIVICGVLIVITGLALGMNFDGVTLYQIFALCLAAFITDVVLISFAVIAMNITGSSTAGLIVFLIVGMAAPMLLVYVQTLPFDLQNVMFYTAIDKVANYLMSSKIDWMNIFLLALYVVASLGISIAFFRKRELK